MGFMRWFGERKPIVEQSPLYRFTKTNFTANEVWSQNLDQDATTYGKYSPFNYIQITNNTDQSLTLNVDGFTVTIPAGVIRSIDSETVPAFRYYSLTNGSSSATGAVEVIVQRLTSYKDVIRYGG